MNIGARPTAASHARAKLTAAERAQIAAEEAKATEEAQNEAEQGTNGPFATGTASRSRKRLELAAGARRPWRSRANNWASRTGSGLPVRTRRLFWADPGGLEGGRCDPAADLPAAIPRRSQRRQGRPETRRPIFFYSDLSHVSLYARDGMVLDAPRPGKTVRYIKMSYMPYVGAKRPG